MIRCYNTVNFIRSKLNNRQVFHLFSFIFLVSCCIWKWSIGMNSNLMNSIRNEMCFAAIAFFELLRSHRDQMCRRRARLNVQLATKIDDVSFEILRNFQCCFFSSAIFAIHSMSERLIWEGDDVMTWQTMWSISSGFFQVTIVLTSNEFASASTQSCSSDVERENRKIRQNVWSGQILSDESATAAEKNDQNHAKMSNTELREWFLFSSSRTTWNKHTETQTHTQTFRLFGNLPPVDSLASVNCVLRTGCIRERERLRFVQSQTTTKKQRKKTLTAKQWKRSEAINWQLLCRLQWSVLYANLSLLAMTLLLINFMHRLIHSDDVTVNAKEPFVVNLLCTVVRRCPIDVWLTNTRIHSLSR